MVNLLTRTLLGSLSGSAIALVLSVVFHALEGIPLPQDLYGISIAFPVRSLDHSLFIRLRDSYRAHYSFA